MDTSELCMRIKATPNFCWCDGIWPANGSIVPLHLNQSYNTFLCGPYVCPERVGPPRSG